MSAFAQLPQNDAHGYRSDEQNDEENCLVTGNHG